MNRTQKNAWFGLVNCLLAIIFSAFFFCRAVYYIPKPGFRFDPPPSQMEIILNNIVQFWPLILPVIALVLLLVPRKKQSPVEPDFDELDVAVQNKAVYISFISVWLLWPLAVLFIMLRIGITGTLSAVECLFIHFGVFLVCMAVYFSTMIVLYGRQTRGGAV